MLSFLWTAFSTKFRKRVASTYMCVFIINKRLRRRRRCPTSICRINFDKNTCFSGYIQSHQRSKLIIYFSVIERNVQIIKDNCKTRTLAVYQLGRHWFHIDHFGSKTADVLLLGFFLKILVDWIYLKCITYLSLTDVSVSPGDRLLQLINTLKRFLLSWQLSTRISSAASNL